MNICTRDLAVRIDAELIGPADIRIDGINFLDEATPSELTFIGSEKYASMWPNSRALAALVTRGLCPDSNGDPSPRALLIVQDVDLALARALEIFAPRQQSPTPGVARSAAVDPTAIIDPDCSISELAQVGARCRIGRGTILEHHVCVGPDVIIGEHCVIRAGAVIREGCILGHRISIHPNAVIGADGFGYRPDGRGGLVKLPHIGIVVIHDDVEIGACSTIDRGKFGRTVIGPHCKLDNLVQIGHNVRLGRGCVLAAQSGIAGSSVLGEFCQIGGKAGISDHLTLGNFVKVAATSGVMRDASDGETIAGTPAINIRQFFRVTSAVHRLPDLLKRLNQMQEEEQDDDSFDESIRHSTQA